MTAGAGPPADTADARLVAAAPQVRAPVGLRANFLLAIASLGVALAAVEIAARAFLPAAPPWRYPQLQYQADPAVVFTLVPNQEAFTADKPATINARGLRGTVIPYARTAPGLRLLFLGDSIVFGYGVEQSAAVTARVAARLSETVGSTEAINSGVPGYNTEQEVTYLEREGIRYHPDWVIVGVCWNDINDKSDAQVSPQGWLVASGERGATALTGLAESGFAYAVRNALKRSRLVYGALQGGRAIVAALRPDSATLLRNEVLEGRETPRVAQGWQRVGDALHRLHTLAAASGFRPLLVAFPIPIAVERPFPHSSYPSRLRALADREGMPLLDLNDAFRAVYRGHESLFIPYDGDHPNAVGHDVAARAIVDFLMARGLSGAVAEAAVNTEG